MNREQNRAARRARKMSAEQTAQNEAARVAAEERRAEREAAEARGLIARGYAFGWCAEWRGTMRGAARIVYAVNGERGTLAELSEGARGILRDLDREARAECLTIERGAERVDLDGWSARAAADSAYRALINQARRLGWRADESAEEAEARAEAEQRAQSGAESAVSRYLHEAAEVLQFRARYCESEAADLDEREAAEIASARASRGAMPIYCGGDAFEWISRAAVALAEIMSGRGGEDIRAIFAERGAADLHPSALFAVVRARSARERRESCVERVTLDEAEAARAASASGGEYFRLSRILRAAAAREDRDRAYMSKTAVVADKARAEIEAASLALYEREQSESESAASRARAAEMRAAVAAVLRDLDESARAAAGRFFVELSRVPFRTYRGERKPSAQEAARRAFPELSEDAARNRGKRLLAKLRAAVESADRAARAAAR